MGKQYILVCLWWFACSKIVKCADVEVQTVYGKLRGIRTDKSIQFLGVPYATPPIGNLRWQAPKPPVPWQPAVINATTHAPACSQKYCDTILPSSNCPTKTSEDCLYLNIWTPLDASIGTGYPTMVFLHGGAFKWGSGSMPIYDGNNLVEKGHVILINVDYRLGLLGFLYTGDGVDDAHGNYGILDQKLALAWVQQNIKFFGGDPNKVTLFGQSAGAQSVFIHMMSPKTNALFRGAIVESAPFAVPYRTKSEALLLTKKVLEILKCPEGDMLCLRFKSDDEINDAQQAVSFKITAGKFSEYFEAVGPIIDGNEITEQPMAAASLGRILKIPVMFGTVTEEGRLFVYGELKHNLSKIEYETILGAIHPSHFREVKNEYTPQANVTEFRDILCHVIADYLFTCSTRNVTRNVLKNEINVHLYVFDHATSFRGGWGNDSFCEDHVCHSEELSFVFGNSVSGNWTAAEQLLSEAMTMYWSNFAYSLDPNIGIHIPFQQWPLYTQQQSLAMHFLTPQTALVADYRQEYCNLWDSVNY